MFADIAAHGARLQLTETQIKRIDTALEESDSLRMFLTEGVRWDAVDNLLTTEIIEAYAVWCRDGDITPLSENLIQRNLPSLMLEKFQASKTHSVERKGKQMRGYRNVALVKNGLGVG